ncbi:MAG: hypothetical protein RMA76_27595 [Deltaproteobacteria bacterium]|jgi:hypothetical protein
MNPEQLRAYVLGRLSPEDHDAVEEAAFLADDTQDAVRALRSQLVQAYRDGTLPADERAIVAKKIEDERAWADELGFAEALEGRADARPREAPRAKWQWLGVLGLAAAAAVVALVVLPKEPTMVNLAPNTYRADAAPKVIDGGGPVRFVVTFESTVRATSFVATLRAGDRAVWTASVKRPEKAPLIVEVDAGVLQPGLLELELATEWEVVARIPLRVR